MQSNRNNFWGYFFALLGVIFVSWFAFVYRAEAATVLENSDYSIETAVYYHSISQYLGDLTGVSFDRIKFYAQAGSPYNDLYAGIATVNCGTGEITGWVPIFSGDNITNINSGNDPAMRMWEIPTQSSTTGSGCYALYTRVNSSDTGQKTKLSLTGNDFTTNARYTTVGSQSNFFTDGTAFGSPMFVQVCNGACDAPAPPAPSYSVDITSPASSTTPIAEFSDWEISYKTAEAESSVDFYSVAFYVSKTETTTDPTAIYYAGSRDLTPTSTEQTGILVMKPFGMLGGTGTWYAQAFLDYWESPEDTTPAIVAVSDIIRFTLNYPQQVYSPLETPTSTATSSEWVLTCDPDDPLVQRSLCNVFKFLFYPSSGILEKYSELFEAIKNKPPFGYITATKNIIDDINYSATSSAGMVDLEYLDTPFFSPMRAVVSTALYIIFVFWLFGRAREFNF